MSDPSGIFDDAPQTDGTWAAYRRSTSRYGRRHHDHDTDRWARHEHPRQDND